ncbi:hypothetical protein SAMN04487947_0041 [Halogeometricum rufum]|jgi:hypothetical protein|uniref:Uncharacterized protein n=1 Tax=Halogeometricum rufum TaxID=553469 RepID=A0A1I6FUQ8_9EURY|nr:hypothetical protein [Halogeometricum rufum]SFR33670.1 hypothetical protein SAMN04487947_0041 [Halogeometricum rufum]
MSGKKTESCGRCAMSTVVDAADDGSEGSNPFDGDRIELSDRELRTTSPAAWASRLVSRLDGAATRLVYGRR